MKWIVRGTIKKVNIVCCANSSVVKFEMNYKDIYLNENILAVNKDISENDNAKLIAKGEYLFEATVDAGFVLSVFENRMIVSLIFETDNIKDIFKEGTAIRIDSIELDLEK
ncbi:MAG: hypothetical protein HRU80_05270 [Ignavibacteriales bacterium]|nr:hypothetical protein [Ignavibacteriaceae bacterium]QOJ28318.1 MAG: hypothetical protein HRU80_05270 [Ignavibacteriales bacterium]